MTAMQTRTGAVDAFEAVMRAAIDATNACFERDPEKGIDATKDGVVIMTDGDPGDPEVLLSPVAFSWEHPVELEITAKGPERRATVEALIALIDPALAADRTLGGTVDDARVMSPPRTSEYDVDGADTERSAVLMVRLAYTTASGAGYASTRGRCERHARCNRRGGCRHIFAQRRWRGHAG